MTTQISILIPIYNGIEFLEDSLSSIIKQTYKNWEVIIGINGHPPGSDVQNKATTIANKYNHDIRIIYYNTKGKPATLNEMVKDAKYDFIALLDVDDIWHENKLAKQIHYLETYDVVGTGCRYFGDVNHCPNLPYGDLRYFNFLHFNPIINSSAIIRKEYANWDDIQLEDYDLWLKLNKNNKKFYNIDEILVFHRIYNSSAFNNTNYLYLDELKNKWSKFT